MGEFKIKKFITAKDVFNGLNQYLYGIGMTGKIVSHKIINMKQFEDLIIFKIKDRGIVLIDNNKISSTTSGGDIIFTDPRFIQTKTIQNLIKEIKDIDEKIDYFNKIKKDKENCYNQLKVIDHNNKDFISNFLLDIQKNGEKIYNFQK